MNNIPITYVFHLPGGTKEVFKLELNGRTLELQGENREQPPDWAKLDFHKCPHCPLSSDLYPHCPLALRLVNIVDRFEHIISHDTVHMEVETNERKITQETSAQRAIGSLMGLVMATSGCPHTKFFRPMARFHLPVASSEETIYRAAAMYMLAQYFLKQEGHKANLDLEGLSNIYENMQVMNRSIVDRLRSVTESDSSLNAVIVLDAYAKTFEIVIRQQLSRIRHLFDPFFTENSVPIAGPSKEFGA